jgi:hypothetical protein
MNVAGLAKDRKRSKKWVLVLALCAAFEPLKSSRSFAQEPPCPFIECRASWSFKTCSKATEGKPLLTMRVTDVSRGRCSQLIVKLRPENAAAHNLPEEIEMEFDKSCGAFDGKVGDTTQIALKEEHSLSTRV